MSNEQRENRESIEGISIPAYFDRYVTSEFRGLEGQITAFKEYVKHRFEEIDRRFIDLHLTDWQKSLDLRFDNIDKRLERIERKFKWVIKLLVFVNIGILAIIVKQFLG